MKSMQHKMDDIMTTQEYILCYGVQVINMVGMSDMDDINEPILPLRNELQCTLWLTEQLSLLERMLLGEKSYQYNIV